MVPEAIFSSSESCSCVVVQGLSAISFHASARFSYCDLLDGQGLCISDVCQVRDELETVDDLAAGRATALDAEAEHAAEALLEVPAGYLVAGVALQAGVRDPRHVGARLEVVGKGEGVGGVALGAQAQGLDAEEQLLGGEGVEGGAQVAQDLDARTDDEADGAEGLPELEPVVALGRLNELRESRRVLAPVELARVDDDAADGGAVAADPLGGRVDDDVCAVVDGADEVAPGAKGVVDLPSKVSAQQAQKHSCEDGRGGDPYDQRHALVMRRLGNGLEVGHVVARVADGLEVDGLGLVVDGGGDVLGAVALDELGGDAQARQKDLELVVGAAVQVGGGDNVVAGVRQRVDGHELRALARRGGQRGHAAFQGGHALLEDVDGGLGRVSRAVRSGCVFFMDVWRGLTFMIRE